MYCLYVGVDYTYIDINALPLLGLEPMAPICLQLLVSHANLSAMYVCMYVCMYICVCDRESERQTERHSQMGEIVCLNLNGHVYVHF